MQSRLYINGKEVRNPVVRGLAATVILAIIGLILLIAAVVLFSVVSLALAVGIGIAGIGLGALAARRAIMGRQGTELPEAEWHLIEEKKHDRETDS